MKKYFLNFCLIFISTVFFSCDRVESRFLIIKNESKSEIVCIISEKELNLVGKNDRPLSVDVEVNKEGNLNPVKPSWERFIKKCDGQKLRFYIISKDSISKYGLDTILKKNMYIRKDYFTIEDLEKINFHITYE